jgi:hypothetical protein
LAAGTSIVDVAKNIGVDESTIHRWKNDPEFIKELDAEIATLLRASRARIRSLIDKAYNTLSRIMDGDNDAARARVALAVLHSVGAIREPEPDVDPKGNKVVRIEFVAPGKIGVTGTGDA